MTAPFHHPSHPSPPPPSFLHFCSFSTRIYRACLGKYTMMTRGKRRSPATATPSIAGKKPKAGVSKSPGRSRSKAQVPAINRTTGTHPSALARQPVIQTTSAAPAPAPSASSTATNSATANLLPELTSAISAAVVQSQRSAGLLSTGRYVYSLRFCCCCQWQRSSKVLLVRAKSLIRN